MCYEGFAKAIDDREKAGNILESRFVGIDKADFTAADLKGKRASITVQVHRRIHLGDPQQGRRSHRRRPKQMREITDVWTFERDTGSRDPNWKLVATDEPAELTIGARRVSKPFPDKTMRQEKPHMRWLLSLALLMVMCHRP